MANLIITVISIALVAVAALMGAYYGGTAFMNGQNKSAAVTLKNNFEQVASAMTLYQAETGQNIIYAMNGFPYMYFVGDADNIALLVPKYLSAFPSFITEEPYPGAENLGVSPGYYDYTFATGGTYLVSRTDMTGFSGGSGRKITAICKEVAKMARGSNALPQDTAQDFRGWATFDCGYAPNGGQTNIDECIGQDCLIMFAYRQS